MDFSSASEYNPEAAGSRAACPLLERHTANSQRNRQTDRGRFIDRALRKPPFKAHAGRLESMVAKSASNLP
jgi:hypothetical protein